MTCLTLSPSTFSWFLHYQGHSFETEPFCVNFRGARYLAFIGTNGMNVCVLQEDIHKPTLSCARRTYNASKVLWKMLAHLSETISVDKMAMVFFDPRNLLIRCIILQKTDGSSWASLGPSEGWIERRLV